MRWWYRMFDSNRRAGARAVASLLAQIDQGVPATPETVVIPADLKDLKDTYENAMVGAKERFDSWSRRARADLNRASAAGINVTERLESGLSDYLTALVKVKRRGWLYALGFAALALVFVVLDFVPTKLVLDSVFQSEPIEPMLCSATSDVNGASTSCLIDRDLMLVLAVLAFLSAIVIMGHVSAVFAGGDYFDGNRSAVGWMVILATLAVIGALTFARYVHEEDIAEEKYAQHIAKLQESLDESKMGSPDRPATRALAQQLNQQTSSEGKEKWLATLRMRIITNASLFTVLTVVVFIGAFCAGLWHRYKDLNHLRLQRPLIQAHKKVIGALSRLDYRTQVFLNEVEGYRQSTQREVAEFFQGAEAAVGDQTQAKHKQFMELSKLIQTRFNQILQLPDNLTNTPTSQTSLPAGEHDWGNTFRSFLDKVVLYDAYEQGGRDAIYIGKETPDSILTRVCGSHRNGQAKDHSCLEEGEIRKKYSAGFELGRVLSATHGGTASHQT